MADQGYNARRGDIDEVHLQDTIDSLDAPTPGARDPLSSGHGAVALVEGSGPDLSQETDAILRDRLRIASLVLSGVFGAFLVKHFLFGSPLDTTADYLIFGTHIAVTLWTGLVAFRLCTNCATALRNLRTIELSVFLSSATFMALVTWVRTSVAASQGYFVPMTAPWMFLIFTYALLIPNKWKRASALIIPMALTPIVVLVALKLASEDFFRLMTEDGEFQYATVESAMSMTATAVVAIWGIRNLTRLRREAFKAKQLGQYQLKQKIGAGGMGEVYVAQHRFLRRPCAIKLIHPDKAGDPRVLARFEREVQATAKLTHWNTVDIYDFGRAEDGTFYYVMEYLPGLNLQQLVERYGSMPAGRVIHLLAQTCDALGEAHGEGMIHRDIKPANIFAAQRGHRYDVAKLLDLGLVRHDSTEEHDTSITQDHTLLGSPLYMSPEQARGEDLDFRSDIYSLGVVAFTMLAGRPPFTGNRPLQVITAHSQKDPPKLSILEPDVPADLERVVEKALAKRPEDRYQTAREFRAALLACDAAGEWSWDEADAWWTANGCPQKKKLDEAIDNGQLSEVGDQVDLQATMETARTVG